MANVIVTRPQHQGTRTARELERRGHKPILLPLTRIVPLAVAMPETSGIACIAATSANALRHLPDGLTLRFRNLVLHAVGNATADAARKAGFADVRVSGGDAEALGDVLTGERPPGRVLYLCGRVRKTSLEERLAAAGIGVVPLETYDTVFVSQSTENIRSLFAQASPVSFLLYSENAARAFANLLASGMLPQDVEIKSIICMSEAVAESLPDAERPLARIAREPTEAAMLDCL